MIKSTQEENIIYQKYTRKKKKEGKTQT